MGGQVWGYGLCESDEVGGKEYPGGADRDDGRRMRLHFRLYGECRGHASGVGGLS